MNSARLFALSALARGGPMHGYQIRRAAKLDRTELWTDIKAGSLYSVLHRMEREGLIEVVRTERDAGPPERTVYAITEHGRQELVRQRDAALRKVRVAPDPLDLALQYTPDLSRPDLTAMIEIRRQTLVDVLAVYEREQRTAAPHLVGLEPMVFEHVLARIRADLSWHEALLAELSKLTADP